MKPSGAAGGSALRSRRTSKTSDAQKRVVDALPSEWPNIRGASPTQWFWGLAEPEWEARWLQFSGREVACAMIKVDDGELLSDILKWSVAGFGTAFEVAVPSFEPSGLFSRSMMQAAALGTRVRFFTRWPEEKDKQDALAQLMAHDVAVVIVPHLQAQAALLTDESTGLWYGWVEGVAFLGCGDA